MKHWIAVFVIVVVVVFVPGCGDDDSTGPDPVEPTDVDSFLRTMPEWDDYAPPLPSEDDAIDDPDYEAAHLENSVRWACKTTPMNITETPEKILTYSPSPGTLYLGSLIQGETYAYGVGGMQELPIRQRAPLTITIDNLAFSANTRTVANPDASSVNQAIQEMVAIADDEGLSPSSNVLWDQVEAQSSEQTLLELGLSARYMGASARGQFGWERTSREHTYAAKFVHEMFTTSMVVPQVPSDLFSRAFTQDELQRQIDLGRVGPDNPPVYVSEITWGRMLVVTITSTYSRQEIDAALDACYQNISGGVEMSTEVKNLLASQETHYSYLALGGDVQGIEGLIRSGEIGDYFATDAELTTAVPLSYKLNNLADNSPAVVSETFTYDEVECSPSVQIHDDFLLWEQAVNELDGTTREFLTTSANVSLCDEVDAIHTSNVELGGVLTWWSLPTAPEIGLRLTASQGHITWNDNEGTHGPRDLSIGDCDNWENDDFDVEILGTGCDDQMVGLGLTVHDNTWTSEERLVVYDANGVQMAHFTKDELPTGAVRQFMGIVSPLPFTLVRFNEDVGGDDIFVADFMVGAKNCEP